MSGYIAFNERRGSVYDKITQYSPYVVKYVKNLTLQHDSMGNLIYKN